MIIIIIFILFHCIILIYCIDLLYLCLGTAGGCTLKWAQKQ